MLLTCTIIQILPPSVNKYVVIITLKIIILTYFQWDGGAIVEMGWSVSEDLLCVADDGSVFVYDIHGAIKKTLTMGQVSEILW